ncbi:MAG: N-methyl-L-tryptophan oxidase [Proteobacteria bacterium]|nr:N-methyl-L-tryptophan oxidase [Pseudomonadota bacterium]NDE07354.1 N-methyl-L-tryptophan oxidase [Chloroflexota bacterium]NDF53586.1 N-methyl-L-tryptophan oxidase [Pseudomonadota bacterium]
MSETFDVVVLGLGVMGASAVHQLAGRGVRVLGLDANQRGHVLGSSHGRSRIIREAYYEAAEYVPLVQRAFIQWRELEEETGLDLLLMTGCLNIGRPGTQVVDGVIASARRHGLPSEVLPSDAMRSRFPAFALPESHVGVYQPTAGVLNADACVGALVDASVARGATIRHGELVNNWEPDGDGVIVRTPSGTIRAQKLVITAGPWSASVLADLGLPLQAVRQYVVHFEPQAPERFSAPGFPAFIWDVAEGEVYGIPYLPGSGFKVGGHDPGEPCTPETARRTVTAEEIENVRSIFERCLPGCATTMSMAATCLYTVTPDRHFIIDRHPEHPQVSYAAGFSGHGFKFGPTIGEVLADLAIEGSSRHDVAFLRAARFPAAS